MLMLLWGLALNAQVLISATPIVERDVAWLQQHGVPNAMNGVDVFKLTYRTPAVDGTPSVASAAFVIPQTTCARPLLCYIHGSTLLRSDVPSNWQEGIGGMESGYTYGASGIACVLPDLLGLGDSPGLHPYLHAASEATACMDAVRAAREFVIQHGDTLNEQLFLVGASAGAHSALATAQVMQTEFPEEFRIAAVAGSNGPYAIYPVINEAMTDGQVHEGRTDLVYVLLSYNEAYPELFNSPSDFMVSPYDTLIPPLFDGQHDKTEIEPLLPPIFSDIIPATLRSSLITDPDAPLIIRFQENTVFNWTPTFPVELSFCSSDDFVSPINSILAISTFQTNGAEHIYGIEPSQTANHVECGQLAQPTIVSWILSMKVDCDGVYRGHLIENGGFALEPDPVASGEVTLALNSPNSEKDPQVRVMDMGGRVMCSGIPQRNYLGKMALNTSGWPTGTYIVELRNNGSIHREKLVVLR